MLMVGVDLAAEAARTAVAWIDWDETTAVVRALLVGAADADILAAIMEADKAGIDCPLGWPDEFVSFVSAHRAGGVDITADVAGGPTMPSTRSSPRSLPAPPHWDWPPAPRSSKPKLPGRRDG